MDGDSSAKTMDKGASAALRVDDFGSTGIHEDAVPRGEPAGEKTTGTGTPAFSAEGSIGKQFTSGGSIGQIGEKVGGPFSSQGAIGKQFTTGGAIGGTVQEQLGKGENNTFQK
ncbi:hypothetical protein AUEXF2481DRAFT_41537 [Aureobasidium subglaciale EXF-2481]|uniref:Uncharacterized protein n=1 Tax=Aureobasidium subglaciale (strain EXF-2481) TaxID=1043005 RepID=A0A074Y7X5_AURSE|nr:uncharacterized protein AUEXF2481DRAFT_41537 [Aureobasidium subglaciale EXF-2481]KAI5246860.1 hypothetical protein E4T43_02462 [Aureobasidium subglaciale]KAI5274548.1 hypothetical protein E4T47_02447 [Aureobasidium subglaciale]KEQ93805.1 hypothetical protein AUEXF2481DRAFT_41537 [Aureobasidium subglaciale EXF-2481]